MQKIAVLGSTGSIGTQALTVVDCFPDKLTVAALAARSNIERLEEQVRKYSPEAVAVCDSEKARLLEQRLRGTGTVVLQGDDGLLELSAWNGADTVLIALVGFSGVLPTLHAVRAGKKIALANKEALVAAGEIIMNEVADSSASIIPVDSEHSAIFQCMHAGKPRELRRIILTASGGPFRDWGRADLAAASPEQALKHPNWEMGSKVTIDSATLMNKGLEVIEAYWLFSVGFESIEVAIHPESIVHSMIEFVDGALVAQLGLPDMLLPIQYALSYPERWENDFPTLTWQEALSLHFMPPDKVKFPCLALAYRAGKQGGTLPAVLNAANEIAVEKFMKKKISFLHIPELIGEVMNRHRVCYQPTLEDIIYADRWARREAESIS